jgi:hypothetical protein
MEQTLQDREGFVKLVKDGGIILRSEQPEELEAPPHLLPCPFCGHEAELLHYGQYWVRCTYIGVCIGNSGGKIGVDTGCIYKEDAIRIWNRRKGKE